jgi:DNA-binding MurR/RpiR family transcriptional regulator
MTGTMSFDERFHASLDRLSPAEQRAARFFRANREEVLVSSASALAQQIGSSDATVVRTAKALGFAGLEELRRALARELRGVPPLAQRIARTLDQVGSDPGAALGWALDIHQASIEALRRDVAPGRFLDAVRLVVEAPRVFAFGIGPSGTLADYLAIQLGRFGLDARSLTHTGLRLADGVQQLRVDDLLLIFAYGRVYRELAVLLNEAARRKVGTVLVTDTLAAKLRRRVDLVLPVARGRADMLSMHTATLALVEALLVGVAAARPAETVASLDTLNGVRAALAGKGMGRLA